MTQSTADEFDGRPRPGLSASAWCVAAAFGAYFCMYGFRKPFTAAGYADLSLWGVGLKTALVIAQVLGYMVAKFIGIKIVAEVQPRRRVALFVALIAAAELSLFLFAITPAPWKVVWMFANGLPLGMVFGLVLGFLEGRRHTEALAAGLCTSFIVADGFVKSTGAYLLSAGVSEMWMPVAAGLLFVPPLLFFAWMLSRVREPSHADVAERGARAPMSGTDRWSFFRRYALGLILLVFVFLLVTILRSVRADFAPEIWTGLQGSAPPAVFAQSETAVAFAILVLTGSAVFIRNNRAGFFWGLASCALGFALIAVAMVGLRAGLLSPFAFMVIHGLGAYLPYIAFHTTLFERLIAMTRDRGNIGYLMYLADSFAYLGYVAVLVARNFVGSSENFFAFFLSLSWIIVGVSLLLLVPCSLYFAMHPATRSPTVRTEISEGAA